MTSLSSILSPSLTTKDPQKTDLRVSLKLPDSSRKAQCDMCKLSYSTEKELLEHYVSLVHHTRLEEKEENSHHECVLCGVNCSNMTDYRKHIITDVHQKKLCFLKGDNDNKINRTGDRESIQTSKYSFLSNSGNGSTKDIIVNKLFKRDVDFPVKEVPNTHNKSNSQFGQHCHQDSHFRYDQDFDPLHSQIWGKSLWRGKHPSENDKHHWSRNSYRDHENSMQTGDKEQLKTQQEQQSYEQSDVYSWCHDYNSSREYFSPWRYESSQDWMGMSNAYQSKGFEQTLSDACEMDFTSDILPNDWDEKSLPENEHALAGIDSGYQSGKYQGFYSSDIGRWYDTGYRDRKRPLKGDDIQESFAKSSRSKDSSSDESIPVRDVPKKQTDLYETSLVNKNIPTPIASTTNVLSKLSTIDDASNNILERAERLCKELREKREASQVQRNFLLKKQEYESLNQRMGALVEKQQLYLKGHIKSSKIKEDEESYDSGIKSSYDEKLKQSDKLTAAISRKSPIDSGASAPQKKATGKMLKEINKTTRESVLDGHEKSQSNFKNLSLLRKTQKSNFRDDAKFRKNSETKDLIKGTAGRPLSKLASKPHLTKDSLKKMVNTPNSRDERLQLVKMLQSRDEQKAATTCASRTGLQLEGLYDSVFDSKELNKEENISPQSVSLEDLSVNVRQQILDLIGRDMSCQQDISKKASGKFHKKISTFLTDVIVLSEDEDVKDAIKNKKNSSNKISNLNSPAVLHDLIKTNKKKKSLTSPASNGVIKNSVVSSLTSPSFSKMLHVNRNGNLRPTSPVQQVKKGNKNSTLLTDNDITTITDSKRGKKHDTFLREEVSHKSSGTALFNKSNLSIHSTKNVNQNSSSNEVRSPILSSDHIQDGLNSTNVVDKFPVLLSVCKADRILSLKENRTDISFDLDISKNTSEQFHIVQEKSTDKQQMPSTLQTNFTSVSPKSDTRFSLAHTIQGETFAETSQSSCPAQQPVSHVHKSDKLVLSPSSLLTSQSLQFQIYEKQPFYFGEKTVDKSPSFTSTAPTLSSSFKDFTVKGDGRTIQSFNDIDHSKSNDVELPDIRIISGASDIDESSSQTMSKLLVLSEKEEHVKQEKMTMDLRLSRLHRLLEQAVVQINMCTDRMNQLHEEEQELLKKRLSLLRVATSLKPYQTSDDVSTENDASFPTIYTSHDYSQSVEKELHLFSNSNTKAKASQGPTSSSISASTLAPMDQHFQDKTENIQGTSLSKTDWLAKFSSYLPKDPVPETNKATESSYSTNSVELKEELSHSSNILPLDRTSQSLPNSLTSNQHFPNKNISSYEIQNLGMRNEELKDTFSLKSGQYDKLSEISSSELTNNSSKQNMEFQTNLDSMVKSTTTTSAGKASSHSLVSVPIMYVGSFRSTDCQMRLVEPVVLVRTPETALPGTEVPSSHDTSKSSVITSSKCKESGNISTYSSNFADLLQLSSPPSSHIMGKNSEHAGEDSDIGSVASSIASGSSLGEQITRYCRATPGASLDSKEHTGAHELSVILSDTSEQIGLDSQEEKDNKNRTYFKNTDWYKNVRDCSLSLERLDNNSRRNVYGALDEKAVKSAEALHLLERNYENSGCPSSITSDVGKRKRRKTKQERDTSDFSRRRHHCIILSSSEEEENGMSKKSLNSDGDALVKGNDQSFGHEISHSQKTVKNAASECSRLTKLELDPSSKVTVGSNVVMTDINVTSPSKTASSSEASIPEFDSSTNQDIVDVESVNLRINNLKEMENNLNQKSTLYSKSFLPDAFTDVNFSQNDILFRNDSQLSRPEVISSHPYFDTVEQNFMTNSGKLGSPTSVTVAPKPAIGLPSYSTIDLTNHPTSLRPQLSSFIQPSSAKSFDEVKLHDVSITRKTSRYSCDYGPVIDICIGGGQMYVGHVNRGVCVYNMSSGLNQDKCVKEHSFPYLQCMSVTSIDGEVTLIVGNGCSLMFCNSTEEDNLKHDLGTTIKCLLSLPPLVYAGLDTGEICMYDTMRKAVRDRCICSDHPIHCLAAGQEGTIKLLCVSSQNGTIIVVNAQQCLPIRILTGHTKTAFSIQVEGHLVFSGSGDHTVLIQNLHTAEVEHAYRESRGLVKSVCYSQGYLFTGGMDKLVRCYNIKTHRLVQVYFGADRGVITKILVHGDLLITGNIAGSVHIVGIDFEARHECHIDGCGLNFGNQSHLSWHLLEDHNILSSH